MPRLFMRASMRGRNDVKQGRGHPRKFTRERNNTLTIEKLTLEQEDYLPVFRQEYLDKALTSKRIDRTKLEPAIEAAYKFIGKEKPLVIILQSPFQAMMTIKFMKTFTAEETGPPLRRQLGGGQLVDQLEDQLMGQPGGGHLRHQLEYYLGRRLRHQLRRQLGRHLRDQLGDSDMWDGNFLWGSQDIYWIAWARFAQHIGVKLQEDTQNRLTIMENISTQCEWWWPYDGICFVSERPIETHWDGAVLHSENGPAVLYEDGYSMYMWRGTRVPKEWIKDKSSITPDIALKWANAEQRRCAMEIIGYENLLKDLGAKLLDLDPDPQIGELYETSHPSLGGNTEKFLRVQCGTGRWFTLPVPPEMKTALEANAWTWGLEGFEYQPEIRT